MILAFKPRIILLSVICLTMLVSCGRNFIMTRDLNLIQKGKSIEETIDLIGRSPKHTFEFEYGDKKFYAGIYNMLYNQYSYTYTSYDSKGNSTTSTQTVVETQHYVVMFVDGKLHNMFWITDTNKMEDDITDRVAPIIVEKYLEEYGDD